MDPKDGAVIWQDDQACRSPSTPAIAGDICITDSRMKGYRLRPDKAEKLFGVNVGDRCGSYILHDGYVYADCYGVYRCLDLTGEILWQKSAGGKISSPVLADGKIFHIVSDKLVMFSATPTMPETFFEVKATALQFSSPAICSGRLFIRLKDGVACYDLTKVPAQVAEPYKDPVTSSDSKSKSNALISFVDVSPSYEVNRKAIKDQVWPPEKEAEAATLDWAMNQELDAEGWIDLLVVQDLRTMLTANAVVYVRVLLEAEAPGKLALSLSNTDVPSNPRGLVVWVNGANVLRQEVAHPHEPVKAHVELVVDLAEGKNTLLVRTNKTAGKDWKLQVQAKALGGLVVKQVAAEVQGNRDSPPKVK